MIRRGVRRSATVVGAPYALSINGTSDYVAIPSWTPKGARYSVELEYTAGDAATFQHLVAADDKWRLQQLATGEVGVSYEDTGDTVRSAGVAGVVDGQRVVVRADFEPDSVTARALGQSDTNGNAPKTAPSGFTTIGANSDRNLRFASGQLHTCSLVDRSAIQGRYAPTGDNTMYGSMASAITMTGDLTIEWDLLRLDKDGTFAQAVLGCVAGNECSIWMNDSSHASAQNIVWNISGNAVALAGVFSDVAQGQHCRVKLERTGTTAKAYIDGQEVATAACSAANYTVDQVFRSATAGILKNSAVANLRITNGDVEHFWPMSESTGDTAVDVAGGNDITWTSPSRVWYPNNNRQYIFAEGVGAKIHDLGAAQHGTTSGGAWVRNYA